MNYTKESADAYKKEMTAYTQTCKFCANHVTHTEPICSYCLPAYRGGERAGKNHAIKETRQELSQLIRKLEGMEIK